MTAWHGGVNARDKHATKQLLWARPSELAGGPQRAMLCSFSRYHCLLVAATIAASGT